MSNVSNREIQNLYDAFNPDGIKTGDRVVVKNGANVYNARVVGLDLDLKNQKVYANLKLFENSKNYPIRVDVLDCTSPAKPLYPGHHNNT